LVEGGERRVCRVWWENLREREQWGDPGVDCRLLLGWIFKK
jgi:hypothetical protein